MKFIAKIITEFEAESPEKAQELLLEYIRSGLKSNCAIELGYLPTKEEEKEQEKIKENISFHDLLNNLNSADMTKN